jgi:hypothetical protein
MRKSSRLINNPPPTPSLRITILRSRQALSDGHQLGLSHGGAGFPDKRRLWFVAVRSLAFF